MLYTLYTVYRVQFTKPEIKERTTKGWKKPGFFQNKTSPSLVGFVGLFLWFYTVFFGFFNLKVVETYLNNNIVVIIGFNYNKYSLNTKLSSPFFIGGLYRGNTAIFFYYSSLNEFQTASIFSLGYIFLIGGGATQINR